MSEGYSAAMADLTEKERYKLLCGIVVPRPIALVTSLGEDGTVNAAPFSFFNVFSETPPLVILGIQSRADGTPKDTARNIRRSGEFVVNLVDEASASAMNDCAIDFPPELGEPAELDLATAASDLIAPPRLAGAPFALECRRHTILSFGPERDILLGEVLAVHARPGLVDADRLHVDVEAYRPLARLVGDQYARLGEVFSMRREAYPDFAARKGTGRG